MPRRKTTRRKWTYPRRTEEMVRRQAREARFEDHLAVAYCGDVDPLVDYLLLAARDEVRLSRGHVEQLAEFLRRRRAHLRRLGKRDLNPQRDDERYFLYLLRQRKRQRYGDREVPKGGWDYLFEEVTDLVGDDELMVDINKVRADLKRGKARS